MLGCISQEHGLANRGSVPRPGGLTRLGQRIASRVHPSRELMANLYAP
jgi:hypothetical protein